MCTSLDFDPFRTDGECDMSKKDDTIKALKKKLKKLKAKVATLKAGGKTKVKEANGKPKDKGDGKPQAAKKPGAKAVVKPVAKSESKREPMKIVAPEPAPLPPPARVAAG